MVESRNRNRTDKQIFAMWFLKKVGSLQQDQVRTIIKKGWCSDIEILEIHQKRNNEQDCNTKSDTPSINKQKQPNRNEPQTSENRTATQPNNPQQTLIQEQKVNLENLKRIMNGEKTTIPSLRNIEWGTVKTETKKINQVLPYISTNNITELN